LRRIHYYYLAWIAIPLVILSTSLFAIHNHLYSETYSYSLQLVSSEGYTDGFLAYMPLTGTLQVSLVCQGGGDIKVNVSVVAETRTSLHLPVTILLQSRWRSLDSSWFMREWKRLRVEV